VSRKEHEPGKASDEHFQQMTFEAMEDLVQPEIILDRCLVTSQPTYTKKGKGYQWDCIVRTLPDLFNQEQNETYHLHAATSAKEASKKRVQPGDILLLRGIPYSQELPLQSGETQTINHLTVSEITVLARAPRKTITVFDAKNGI
jgi:hypothetical protein